jgi:hypothetical protein
VRRVLVSALTICLTLGCSGNDSDPTAPGAEDPGTSISDGAHGGNPRFYWLPPLAASRTYSGTFDGTLDPIVVACRWTGSSCTAGPLTWGATQAPSADASPLTVSTAEGQYSATWRTTGLIVGAIYRLEVLVGAISLGYVDVRPVIQPKKTSTGAVEVRIGSDVPVKFRIERGATTVLPAASEPLIAKTRAVLNAPDPVAAATSLLNDYVALLDQYGLEEGSRQLDAIEARAFDLSKDSAALANVNSKLAGAVFETPILEETLMAEPGGV